MRLANFFFNERLEQIPEEFLKMTEMMLSGIERCVRDPGLISRHAIHQDAGIVDGYAYLAPVIDTDNYMVCLADMMPPLGFRCLT